MRNKKYWKERFRQLEASEHHSSEKLVEEVGQQMRRAEAEITRKINAWYGRLAANNGISMAEAKKLLNRKELEEFRWDVNDYIKYGKENAINGQWMKQLENASARVHISRLEQLKLQVQQEAERLYGNYLDGVDRHIKTLYEEGFYKTAYEIQKGIGVGWNLTGVDSNRLDKIIRKPWAADGKNFSERIWSSKQQLVENVHTSLTQMCILGQSPDKAIASLAHAMHTSKNQAGRLIMTESAFFGSESRKDCLNELGVEQYEIVATLDSLTSDICREMDGKVFPMKDFEPGVTAPPFHVRCRTTTVPHFGDEFDFVGQRAARNEDGKTYYVPSGMTYPEWEKAMVDGDKSGLQEISDSGTIKTEAEIKLESVIRELPIISDIKTDDDRRVFAERLIDGLGIDHSNIPIAVEKTDGARGACSFYPQKDQGVCDYVRYSLEKGDDRRMEYQIKTAFHEAYHLSCQGKEWDAVLNGGINPKWVSIEETFAEASAHYAAQIYGINDIAPAYANTLIQTLPRLKHIENYSECTTLTDFGKISWNERLSGGGGRWAALYEKVFAVTLDESDYYRQYFEYVRKNIDSLVEKTLENSPKFRQYKDFMKEDLESAMQKIESGVPVTELNQNEGFIFPQVLINAMVREGVK